MEQWRDIPGWEDRYQASTHGRIRSKEWIITTSVNTRRKPSKILTGTPCSKGYLKVTLHRDGKQYTKKVHRLVAEAFIPNPDNLPDVDHKFGDKLDNRPEMLQRLSKKSHRDKTTAEGAMPKGKNHHNSKLNEQQVSEIIDLLLERKLTGEEIGELYGVKKRTISNINMGDLWKSVRPEINRPVRTGRVR